MPIVGAPRMTRGWFSRRACRRSCWYPMSSPSTVNVPAVEVLEMVDAAQQVDLPEPDGPDQHAIAGGTSNDTP